MFKFIAPRKLIVNTFWIIRINLIDFLIEPTDYTQIYDF